MTHIFGYEWEDIQRAQRGGRLARYVDTSMPAHTGPTTADRELLAKYGSVEALKSAGFLGAADRLESEKPLTAMPEPTDAC